MTQQVEAVGTKSDDFSSVLRARAVRGKNQLPQVVLYPACLILETHTHTQSPLNTHKPKHTHTPTNTHTVLELSSCLRIPSAEITGVSQQTQLLRIFAATVDVTWLHSSQ